MLKKQIIIFAVFCMVMTGQHVYSAANDAYPPCMRDNAVQDFLAGMISKDPKLLFDVKTDNELNDLILKLKRLAGNNDANLVSQLFLFSLNAKENKMGMRHAMLPAVIIENLHVSKENIVRGTLPYLESQNELARRKAFETLGGLAINQNDKLDFSCFDFILRRKDDNFFCILVNYMYSKSPELALSTMANVYMTKESAAELMKQIKTTPDWKTHSRYKSEKVKSDSKTLTNLSQRPEWWVQLYVAKCLVRDATPCSPELLKNLKQSKHPLVIQTLQEIEAKIETEKSLDSSKN